MARYSRNRPASSASLRARALVRSLVAFVACAIALASGSRATSAATINNTCSVATSAAAHVLCWLDLAGYTGTGTTTIAWTLPDGSVLSGALQNASATSVGPAHAVPTYQNSEIGHSIYLGIAGTPAIYGPQTFDATPLTLANLQLTDTNALASASFALVGGDAETTDSGDGVGVGYVDWSTTGAPWTVLQHTTDHGQGCTIQIGGTIGALNAQCLAPTTGAYSDVYILRSVLAAGNSVAMSYNTVGADNGYLFAINLSAITLDKTVTARVNGTDEFTVQTKLGPTVKFAATTAGAATTATTGQGVVIPGRAYTLTEVAASGNLAAYTTSIACTNAAAGSPTALPAGAGTSFTVTPATDDQITCTFTNSPRATLTKTVTNVTNPNGSLTADNGKPNDDLRYAMTFNNTTGLTLTGTVANPIKITDTLPTSAGGAAQTRFVASACASPQSGLTCTVAAPAAGATTGTITFTFVGSLAAGASVVGTFDVTII